MIKNKLIIIGGGVIGITIAIEAAIRNLFSDIIVIEKDKSLGTHASTRNSGVIHAGFYYSPESYKAKFCSEGNKLMREYCLENNIQINKCGKVVITSNSQEEIILKELFKRGIDNGSELYLYPKDKLLEYEPLAKTYQHFLWSPNTWSICPKELFKSLVEKSKNLGIKFITNEQIIKVKHHSFFTSVTIKL